jgi:pSer/pThr/pTyr-binding forkhead associated (FHA) protein
VCTIAVSKSLAGKKMRVAGARGVRGERAGVWRRTLSNRIRSIIESDAVAIAAHNPRRSAMSAPLLIVVAGAGRGRSVAIGDAVTIGRGEDNTLAIADPALSRHHCVVTIDANGLLVRDLESKNGVFVNGRPVTARALADGDQIRIGDSALLLVWPHGEDGQAGVPAISFVDTPLPASTVSIEVAASRYLRAEAAARDGTPPASCGGC